MLGLIRFRPAIFVAASDLGTSLDATIGETKLVIELPRLPSQISEIPDHLIAPVCAENYPEGARTSWGRVQSANASGPVSASVECACTMVAQAEITKISALHLEWLDRFGDFVRLITKQGTLSIIRVDHAASPQISFFSMARPIYPADQNLDITVSIIGQKHGRPAQNEDLRRASEWASQGKVAPLPYTLLLGACEAFRKGHNRIAVIEATTALEVAITSKIQAHLLGQGSNIGHVQWLLDAYEGLTRRMGLYAKVLGRRRLCLPNDYARRRNTAAHAGRDVSTNEALAHLETTWEVIEALIPDSAQAP